MSATFDSIFSWLGRLKPHSRDTRYRVFTRAFDVEISAEKLDTVLGVLTPAEQSSFDEAWRALSGALQGWRTKVHLVALEAARRIRSAVAGPQLQDTTVTILVDQSGSMRGQSMILAAAATDVACDFLVRLGASVEVLGFTTVRWKGGQSREKWLRERRPAHPGRLSDLLHIVYRSTEFAGSGAGGWPLRSMLRPDLPKENIDGEAVEWAASRLRQRPNSIKILLVVSDGASVDDSTLAANDPFILERHLRGVIDGLEASPDVRIGAVGIGFDVDKYYSASTTVTTPDDLGDAMVGLLERLIIGNCEAVR